MFNKTKLTAVFVLLFPILIFSNSDKFFELSESEKTYLDSLGKITMCVDPDWMPYEFIDEDGNYVGIGADLIRLAASKLNVQLQLIPTKNWGESLKYSKQNKCIILPLLNQTEDRDEWLLFTEPIFNDPFVFISREEHPFITDPNELGEKIVALPRGTSTEELIRRNFRNLKILLVENEIEAFRKVSNKEADFTVRSLIVAAYTIKNEGLFNLKIAGDFPDFNYNLRVGVIKSEARLVNILNKAINAITFEEREQIVNKHVNLKIERPFDYSRVIMVGLILLLLIFIGFYRNYKLRKLNEERSLLLDNIQVQVWYMTDIDKFGVVNKAHAKFIGKKISEISFKKLKDVMPEESVKIHVSKNLEVFQSKRELIFEDWFPNASGEKRLLKIHKTPKLTQSGNVEYVICSAEDITERREHELKINTYTEVLEKLNKALSISQNEMENSLVEKSKLVEELKKINSEKDKFLAIISHDLRSPFQSFLGLTEIMVNDINDLSSEELFEFSKEINSKANKLYKLLRNLLDWARMQEGNVPFEQKPFLLDKLVANAYEVVKLSAANKEIEVINKINSRIIVNVDANMITSVIQNLLTNAIKFTHQKGNVEISAERENENFVSVSIKDNGIGMDEKMLNNLFKIDQKVNRLGTNGEESTGLGLLLCKEFITKHNGEISVISKPNNGSTFSFTLPTV